MKVIELFSEVRNTLQDLDKVYWDDTELLAYYNECKRHMTSMRLESKTTATLHLTDTKDTYDTSGILRYISCVDDTGLSRPLYPDDESGDDDVNGVILEDYNRVKVNSPEIGNSLIFKIISLPKIDNLDNTVRAGDETALRHYIMSKAYEKDSDMENFQKSEYFYKRFIDAFKSLKDSSSVNYRASTVLTTVAQYY